MTTALATFTPHPLRVLSLGWGVQSFTLAAMAALGDIEPIAAAVHSDTDHERQATYEFAARMTPWLEERGVRVVTVRADDTGIIDKYGGVMPPVYYGNGGGEGRVPRQCTDKWKRAPLRRWLQANRDGVSVDLFLGISMDEFHRAKDSDVKYITHRFPLLDLRMTRADCITYLKDKILPVPEKSTCVFCPFHSAEAWRKVKRKNGRDWNMAIIADNVIRNAKPDVSLYIHRSLKPLPEAVRIPEDEGAVQLTMLDDTACDGGYCFL